MQINKPSPRSAVSERTHILLNKYRALKERAIQKHCPVERKPLTMFLV